MRKAFLGVLVLALAGGVFLLLNQSRNFTVAILGNDLGGVTQAEEATSTESALPPPPAPAPRPPEDIEFQVPLTTPPAPIKAVYATNWSAGSQKKMDYFVDLIKRTELNAIVIDIKDFSGKLAYQTDAPEVVRYQAGERRIPKINALIKRLHNEGIYVIGRVAVFQDQHLTGFRPDLAVQSSSTQSVWRDRKGIAWLDPASHEVWDYAVAIARDAARRGFDEINFDYIRFPSDGALEDTVFPFWNERRPMRAVMRDFFAYLREQLPGIKISADLFGLATVNEDDLGIGQHLEDALPHFDYVAPMVYPSHYASGFIGFPQPAEHPYEVVKYSLETAERRIKRFIEAQNPAAATTTATTTGEVLPRPKPPVSVATMRPWIQDFDLGAVYDAEKVRAQIRAAEEAGASGFMIWAPANIYTQDALLGATTNP